MTAKYAGDEYGILSVIDFKVTINEKLAPSPEYTIPINTPPYFELTLSADYVFNITLNSSNSTWTIDLGLAADFEEDYFTVKLNDNGNTFVTLDAQLMVILIDPVDIQVGNYTVEIELQDSNAEEPMNF